MLFPGFETHLEHRYINIAEQHAPAQFQELLQNLESTKHSQVNGPVQTRSMIEKTDIVWLSLS